MPGLARGTRFTWSIPRPSNRRQTGWGIGWSRNDLVAPTFAKAPNFAEATMGRTVGQVATGDLAWFLSQRQCIWAALGYIYFAPMGLSVCGFADSQSSSFIWQMDDPF